MPDHMRALRLHRRGSADSIVLDEDVPVPKPGIGDALLRVHAASLTPTELGWPSTWVDRAGRDRLPVIPCHEVSGEVVALGWGTTGFVAGDDVFGLTDWYRDGAAAEYVAVETRDLAARPADLPAIEAAALAMPALTAHQALFEHGRLTKGDTALISGATGGVGAVAVQLARNAGAIVIAAGHRNRMDAALDLGADEFVDVDEDENAPAFEGITLVFDIVGGDTRDQLLRRAPGARVVSIVEPHPGVDFFVVEPERRTLEEVVQLVESGVVRPLVAERVPLADGASAFADKARSPGKRVLEVARR
jgi:NADPH:quinone reductase-like Zn-dependent oxidoreductase